MEDLKFREATMEDLEAVVELLHSDKLGTMREQTADLTPYQQALKEIIADANNHVLVAIIGDRVVGTVQLTFIRNLTFQGGLRAQIEGVRIGAALRGKGIGRSMLEYIAIF